MNTTTKQLSDALEVLSNIYPNQTITSLSFEDGSGTKFNYAVDFGKSEFIDLSLFL